MIKYLIIISSLLFIGCFGSNKDEIDYKKYNNRFSFDDRYTLLVSLETHFNKFQNSSALEKLQKINFNTECKKIYQQLIEKNTYEKFIESFPEEFMCFIEHLNSKKNKDYDIIYFNSSQALLRHLSPLNR